MSATAKALLIASLLCLSGCWTPREVFPPMHPHWADHSSRQSRHYANFPGKIKQGLKETKIVSGQTVSTYLCEFVTSDRYYGTAWTLVPAFSATTAAQERILEIAAAEALRVSPDAKLVSRHPVTNEGIRGVAYVIDLPQSKVRLRQQIFMVSGVLVEQTYSGPAGTEDEREPGRFFDSLKLFP